MSDLAQSSAAEGVLDGERRAGIAAQDDARLREALRRCSPATRAAAREFRETGRLDQIPAVIDGLIEHFVEPGARAKLRTGADSLRLAEDLGIDSLTLLEIVFLAEEVFQVTIENEKLRPFRTVGDVKAFVAAKIAGETALGAGYSPGQARWQAGTVSQTGT